MERAAARRLQPYHIRSFFEIAFAEAGGVMRARERGRFEVTRVPPALRDRDRLIGRADPGAAPLPADLLRQGAHPGPAASRTGRAGSPAPRLPDRSDPGALPGPVDPGNALLVDEGNRHDEPRVLVALRHAIRDGRTTRQGKPQTISERLQFVWLDGVKIERWTAGRRLISTAGLPARTNERTAAEVLGAGWLRGTPGRSCAHPRGH